MAKGKYGIVHGVGMNDMPKGWTKANEYNKRIYQVWYSMLARCYSEKYHEKHQTYKNCYCCERWLVLSNFVKDIVKIDGYNYWLSGFSEKINPYQLDKDIKSGGTNKCYCLEQCQFVSYAENIRQANKTRDNTYLYNRTGENHPMYGKYGEKHPMYGKHHSEETRQKLSEANRGELVAQIDTVTNKILNLKYNREYDKLGFNHGNISKCCTGRLKTHKGYIFKYLSDVPDDVINSYIIRTKQIPITN